ncbi:MAG: TetR/AcrR family transcriptional regulator [Paracoccaceae bacterium]
MRLCPASAPRKRGRKYDQVLSGARQVFMADGFDGASVDDIARAAGVSKATLYAYFPDKRLLFIEVARVECDRQSQQAMARIDMNAPIRDVLLQAAHHMIEFFLSDFAKNVFRICVAESDRFPELGREFYESGPMQARARLSAGFQEAAAKGQLQITDFDLAADQFAELCKADLFARVIFGIHGDHSQPEADRIATGAVDMFLARYGINHSTGKP